MRAPRRNCKCEMQYIDLFTELHTLCSIVFVVFGGLPRLKFTVYAFDNRSKCCLERKTSGLPSSGLANASICNARGIPEATELVICSSQRFTKLPSYLGGFPNQEVRRKLGSPSAIPMLVAFLGPSHFFPSHTCQRHRELSSSWPFNIAF